MCAFNGLPCRAYLRQYKCVRHDCFQYAISQYTLLYTTKAMLYYCADKSKGWAKLQHKGTTPAQTSSLKANPKTTSSDGYPSAR